MSDNTFKFKLRSQWWFDDPDDIGMTMFFSERFFNYGLTPEELHTGRPIIGVANSGSDLSPCNYVHNTLIKRISEGIRDAGGIPLVFPVHPIQETSRLPTAALDRNLAYLGLIEILHGNPLDGVVLTTGCDKTTPSQLMAAATVNIPAITINSGPMLDSIWKKKLAGSGTLHWQARKEYAKGDLTDAEYLDLSISQVPSTGHCNTMGTASTMNCLAESLGMSLPGQAICPAPYRDRSAYAYKTGVCIVDMVKKDLKPTDIMNRKAFENAIMMNTALGGSTNAQIHINAIARHCDIEITMQDWQDFGWDQPLLVNMQPAGEYLGEAFYRAGGVPAVQYEMAQRGVLHTDCMTANGRTISENMCKTDDRRVVYAHDNPIKHQAGFAIMTGNMFDHAIMKTSVISENFRKKYLKDNVFTGQAFVFDGKEDYEAKIDDPTLGIDENSILFMRYAGSVGWPGSAEIVNMRPPDYLLKQGINELPTVGDGRQSGTCATPSILNASPEAAMGTGLSILQDGDTVSIDLNNRTVMMHISDTEYTARMQKWQQDFKQKKPFPESQTPWQEMFRGTVMPLSKGGCVDCACKYSDVGKKRPRHNH